MNENICKTIVENKEQFIPALFTVKQVNIMEKWLKKESLTKTEQTYLYSAIKKKIEPLNFFKEGWYIKGSNMIPERIEQAKQMLKEINKEKAFISGSFLFAEKYNDIDIFIISKKRKQYRQGKKQFICITEEDLKKSLFYSAAKYSVANCDLILKRPVIKRQGMHTLIFAYELAINEILDNDDQKAIRDVLFEYYKHVKNTILDANEVYQKFKEIKNKKKEEKIRIINTMAKELLITLYRPKYLYNELVPFIKSMKEDVKEFKAHDNLLIYINLLNEVKDESRRAQA